MPAPSPFFATLSFLLIATSVSAASISLDGLVSNSPFMPPKQEEAAAPVVTEGAAVEFRGMIATDAGMLFGLYDRTKNVGAWVRQDDTSGDFKVSSYDAGNDLVTVDYQGQRFTLPLSSSKVNAAAPSPLPVANTAQTGGNRVTAVPGGRGDEQRRLENVAAEVRRRRALRQSATSNPPAQPTQPAESRP
jgi:hypothetical protein